METNAGTIVQMRIRVGRGRWKMKEERATAKSLARRGRLFHFNDSR